MVNEWWVLRRGLAWGMILSSSGVSGIVFPFVVDALLNRYGYKVTLRATAVVMIILTGPLLPLFKGRLPAAEQSMMARTDWSFLRQPLFWVYCTSNAAQGMGFYLPQLYLPSYATSIGLSATQGALLVALTSIAQVMGQFTFGFLSDGKIPLNVLILSSSILTALASFTLWGLAHSLPPLIFFALAYGFFGYGYLSMRVRMGTAVTREPAAALVIFAIFCFGQGVGNLLAGPISGRLLSGAVNSTDYGASRYKTMVIFTGCTMVLSAMSVCCWYLRPSRWKA
jgi:MFS family permease